MKKNIIICGLIAGAIVTAWMIAVIDKCYNVTDYEGNMLLGYTTMLVAFSLIFVGVKNYRDKHSNGIISFGKAFKMGLMITLIASTIYVIVWLIDYYYFVPDFYEKYSAHMISRMQKSGASQAELQAKIKEFQSFSGMYKNPFFNAMMTYVEILPVGLIVSLLAAIILKRKS